MKLDLTALKAAYGVDEKSETEGKWFPLGLVSGVEMKIARTSNPSYQKALEKKYKPYQKQMRKGNSLAQSIHDKIQIELLAEELVKDWKGLTDSKGKEIPFSVEVARELFSDSALKELRTEVTDFADEFEAFKLEADEELEKN